MVEVYTTIRKIVHSKNTAANALIQDMGIDPEDVIQDLAVKWMNNPKNMKHPFSYLCSFAKNHLLDLKRKKWRGPKTETFDENASYAREWTQDGNPYPDKGEYLKSLNRDDKAVLSGQMSRTEAAYRQKKSYEAYVKQLQRKIYNIREKYKNERDRKDM